MLYSNGLRRSFGALPSLTFSASTSTRRGLHYDGRNRLSNFWTPTQAKPKSQSSEDDGHDLLIRAGFLRQAHSGIFHLLPLGLRVQDKIERLIDKHMLALGASKVSLSSLSSEELWQRSGRLEGRGSEFFRLQDRKEAKFLLSPTHEEEITTIVANTVHSYKDLPLKLYQVSRKYRDEARPRQGLLRGREFVMKDLYTFDVTEEQAQRTYDEVRKAYSAFLDELRLPYLVASADSGNMGGKLSHEYHFASDNGEDTIITCSSCDYSINEELSKEAQHGDACPACSKGSLRLQKAVEIGHTFHLGTRYSEPLDLRVLDASNKQITVSMGCHGIGVSRLIGAAASLLTDKKGLNWPLAIAPFGAMMVATNGVGTEDMHGVFDGLSSAGVDAAIDDRERPMGWKLNDADLVGYPFIVVLGKAWLEKRAVELQCRRLGVKEEVKAEEVVGRIAEYSARL